MTHRFVVSTTKIAIHSNIFRFKPSSSIFKSQQSRYAFCNFISLNRQTPYVGNQFRYFSAANSEDHVITDEQRRKYKKETDARIEELEKLTGAPKELVQKAIFKFPNLQRRYNLEKQKLYIEDGDHGYEKKNGKFVKIHKEVHKDSHDEKEKDSDDEDSVHSEHKHDSHHEKHKHDSHHEKHKHDSHHEKHKRAESLFQSVSRSKKVESMELSDEFVKGVAHIYEPMHENERTRSKSIKVVTNILLQMNDDNFVNEMMGDADEKDAMKDPAGDGDEDEDEDEEEADAARKQMARHARPMKKEQKHMIGKQFKERKMKPKSELKKLVYATFKTPQLYMKTQALKEFCRVRTFNPEIWNFLMAVKEYNEELEVAHNRTAKTSLRSAKKQMEKVNRMFKHIYETFIYNPKSQSDKINISSKDHKRLHQIKTNFENMDLTSKIGVFDAVEEAVWSQMRVIWGEQKQFAHELKLAKKNGGWHRRKKH